MNWMIWGCPHFRKPPCSYLSVLHMFPQAETSLFTGTQHDLNISKFGLLGFRQPVNWEEQLIDNKTTYQIYNG